MTIETELLHSFEAVNDRVIRLPDLGERGKGEYTDLQYHST